MRLPDVGIARAFAFAQRNFEATVAILESTRGDRVRKGRMYEPMSLFTCLHHFYLTMDSAIVITDRVRSQNSPLAAAVGLFPSHLLQDGKQVADLKLAFGFVH